MSAAPALLAEAQEGGMRLRSGEDGTSRGEGRPPAPLVRAQERAFGLMPTRAARLELFAFG
jgi:hypothetical protein